MRLNALFNGRSGNGLSAIKKRARGSLWVDNILFKLLACLLERSFNLGRDEFIRGEMRGAILSEIMSRFMHCEIRF